MRKDVSSACFVQVNNLLLSQSYEETLGDLTFLPAWGETDLGQNDHNLQLYKF